MPNSIGRGLREKQFFDSKFKEEKYVDYYSAGFTNYIFDRMMEKIGKIDGKKVLDFGCGEGWVSKKLLRKGAMVWAFDISEEAVNKLRAKSLQFEPKGPLIVDQMAAEKLSYDSDFFDLIIGVAVLHHTDLKESIKEIHRVLKKGGKAYFMEPLGHNPVLNWYRQRTPQLRSPDEKALVFDDFNHIKRHFEKFYHEEYYLLVLIALFWHFVLRKYRMMLKTRNVMVNIDKLLLSAVPSLRKYCWYTILEMKK